MLIDLVTPAPVASSHGNARSARRWAQLLETLGHQVTVRNSGEQPEGELCIALHATRSHDSIVSFQDRHPERPLVVILTGTDLYGDLGHRPETLDSLRRAQAVVTLHHLGRETLPREIQNKTHIIPQSASHPGHQPARNHVFEVCVLAHLREVKDPLCAARAVHDLPPSSRIQVLLAGKSMDPQIEAHARRETQQNPRFSWLGALPPAESRRLLARCRLHVIGSRSEGGANVLSEALIAGTPTLASKIPGNFGILGSGYPGYFPYHDHHALGQLLSRAEVDPTFLRELSQHGHRRAEDLTPQLELRRWQLLLKEWIET
jgi:putative glycosyltransferase (TIGR04348 family)